MSLSGFDDASVQKAVELVKKTEGAWLLLKYLTKDSVGIAASAQDGLLGAKDALREHGVETPLFGFCHFAHRRTIIKYLPDLPISIRARMTVHFQAFAEFLREQYDGQITIQVAEQLTFAILNGTTRPTAVDHDSSAPAPTPKEPTGEQTTREQHISSLVRPSTAHRGSRSSTRPADRSGNQVPVNPAHEVPKATLTPPGKANEASDQEQRPMTSPVSPESSSFLDLDPQAPDSGSPLMEQEQTLYRDGGDTLSRSSMQSIRTMGSVGYSSYTTFSGKPKLHARPSLLDRQRPHTSASVPRRHAHRPISTLPPGVSIKRKTVDANSPKHSVPPMPNPLFAKSLPALPAMPSPGRPKFNSSMSLQQSDRAISHVADQQRLANDKLTPEKERLMRALALRRANLASRDPPPLEVDRSQPSDPASQPDTVPTSAINRKSSQTLSDLSNRRDEASEGTTNQTGHRPDDEHESIPSASDRHRLPRLSTPVSSSVEQAVRSTPPGVRAGTLSSNALPLVDDLPQFDESPAGSAYGLALSGHDTDSAKDTPATAAKPCQQDEHIGSDNQGNNLTAPDQLQAVRLGEPQLNDTLTGASQVTHTETDGSPPPASNRSSMHVRPSTGSGSGSQASKVDDETPFSSAASFGLIQQLPDIPTAERLEPMVQTFEPEVAKAVGRDQGVVLQPASPGVLHSNELQVEGVVQPSMAVPEGLKSQETNELLPKPETAAAGDHLDSSSVHRDLDVRSESDSSVPSLLSETDSLIESLQTAKIENATPVNVSGVSSAFPAFARSRTPSGARILDEGSGPLNGRMESMAASNESLRSQTQESIIGFAGPASMGTQKAYGELGGLKTKSVNVSRGISQRIKALEMISSRSGSPQTGTRPVTASGVQSPASVITNSGQATVKDRSTTISNRSKDDGAPADTKMKPSGPSRSAFSDLTRFAKLKATKGETAGPKPKAAKEEPVPEAQSMPAAGTKENASRSKNRNSVSVIARIIRSPAGHKNADADGDSVSRLRMSQISIEQQTTGSLTPGDLQSEASDLASPLLNAGKSRRLSGSSRRSSMSRTRARSPVRTSMSSSTITAFEDQDEMPSDKRTKESRRSRIMKRMSSLSSNSRKAQGGKHSSVRSSTVTEEAIEEKPEQPSVPAHLAFLDEDRSVVLQKEVNVQLPDSLLWRRRALRLDSMGCLVLSPVNSISRPSTSGGSQSRHYHLGEFRMIGIPDEDMEDLPNCIQLECQDGGLLQLACGYRSERDQILGKLKDASGMRR